MRMGQSRRRVKYQRERDIKRAQAVSPKEEVVVETEGREHRVSLSARKPADHCRTSHQPPERERERDRGRGGVREWG